MRAILERQNRAILGDIQALLALVAGTHAPAELEPYRARVIAIGQTLHQLATRNLRDLALGREEILEDVLSSTQQASRLMRLLSYRLAVPVVRAAESDRLCLTFLGWLHAEHPRTRHYPPAFGDGSCAIWPFYSLAPVYFFPCVEQRGLLFQPLFFHEFGHLLYVCHKPEMDSLVGDLQQAVGQALVPPSQRNDPHAAQQAGQRQTIVDTWYQWAQEFFCDAIGFVIGGPCYLRAFSAFLGSVDPGEFYRPAGQLARSSHPVTWLRIQLLADRAAAAGFAELARAVREEWQAMASVMGIREDYHGYFDPSLTAPLATTLADMLTEAAPRTFTADEAGGGSWTPGAESVARLLNWAWQVYEGDPTNYRAWEEQQISRLLAGTG